ncbi:MAG: hypothetical protein AAFV53_35125 [Myxococcota bacterium]
MRTSILTLCAALVVVPGTVEAKKKRNRGKKDPLAATCVGNVDNALATNSSNVYLRSAFDTDPSSYLGRFVPDNAASIDESMARRTRCSAFITTREVDGGGVTYDHVYQASSQAAMNIGIPGIAGASGAGGSDATVRVSYTLTKKLIAEVSDPAGFEDCCRENSDSCDKLFIGEFIAGTGAIHCGVGKAADFDLSSIGGGVAGDMSVKHGALWRSATTFTQPVYFAFRTTAAGTRDACGDWINQAPTSADGLYFVGVSDPVDSESTARDDAMKSARKQVYAWALQQTSQSDSTTTRSANSVTIEEMERNTAFSGTIGQLKDRNWCVREEATGVGVRYKTYVLTFLNNDQVDMVKGAMAPR